MDLGSLPKKEIVMFSEHGGSSWPLSCKQPFTQHDRQPPVC